MLIVGAVSFSSKCETVEIAEKICKNSLRYDHLSTNKLVARPDVSIIAIQREQHAPQIQKKSTNNGEIFLIGDVNYSQHDPGYLTSDITPPGRWISIELCSHSNKVTFTTDILGSFWVYYAKIPGGYAFANDFAALVKSLPYTPTIDKESIGLELALSYCPDNATMFEEIKVLPSASITSIDAGGIESSSQDPIVFTDTAASLSENGKFEALDQIYSDIASKYVSSFENNIVLSLSAGYDSRYALATLNKYGIQPEYCTFGNPNSSEVINAEIVANYMGASTHIFDYETGQWNEWVNAIESLGTTGMIQWNGWAERWLRFESKFGTASVSGYLGDALTGKHLGDNPSQNQDWIAFWSKWSTGGGRFDSPLITQQLRRNLSEFVSRSLSHSVQGQEFAFPHQAAMYLDLYGRQRRRVANQANLTSRFLTPVLFFYDKTLIEFWCSLGFDDLHKQKMYIEYANTRFNDIFNIYDQGKKRSFIERLGNKYNKLVHNRGNRNAAVARPKVIEHNRLIEPNKQEILSLIERVEPVLNPVIDLEILKGFLIEPSTSPISSAQAIQAINFCILANLIVK